MEAVIRMQVDILTDAGYQVSHYYQADSPANSRFSGLWPRFLRQPLSLKTIRTAIRLLRTDTLVILHYPEVFIPLLFWLLRLKASVMVIHHAEPVSKAPFFRTLVGWLHSRLYRKASSVICASRTYWNNSQAGYYYPSTAVNIIPLACEDIAPRNPEDNVSKSADTSVFKLLFVGRLVRYKGLPLLLDCMNLLGNNYRLEIVGDGYLRQRLQHYWEKRGLRAKVVFRGALSAEELLSALDACDALILSSLDRTEAFGLSLLEALRAGKPIITPKIAGSGVLEVNPNGTFGSEFRPGSVVGMHSAILSLKSRIQLEGEALSRRCRDEYERRYRREYHARELLKVVAALLNR